MDVSEVAKVSSLKKARQTGASAPIQDRLSISSESEKRAQWVEELKRMPDVRVDKLNMERATLSSQELARCLLEAGF